MNILIVRLGALGDIVHAIPAAAALRRAFPDARIDWLVEARHRTLVELVTTVDRTVVIRRSTPGWIRALRELRASRYDVALDFQGLIKSAVLARGSGAARVAGFSLRHLREKGARPFYSTAVDGEGGHAIVKNLRLLRTLGLDDARVEFPLAPVESPVVDAVRTLAGGERFALVNPGAAWPNKRWPADRFGALARSIREREDLVPVVLWGPGERPLADAVVAASSGAAMVAPPTTIVDLVALCRAADLLIAGDTGPLHVASAVGTPVVGLFGPTNPARNGPWPPDGGVISRTDQCGCHMERRCRQSDWCLADIPVTDVSAAVHQRLITIGTRA